MIRPRPQSLIGSSVTCGPHGAPSSVTSIRATAPRRATSTVNQPPCPLEVCWIAFVPSSTATEMRSSRAGPSGSKAVSQRRSCRSSLS